MLILSLFFGWLVVVQVAKLSAEATSGDEGIEWIKNEPYDNTDGESPFLSIQAHIRVDVALQRVVGCKLASFSPSACYHHAGHMGFSKITGTTVPRNKGQYTLKRCVVLLCEIVSP